jgi:mRNA-degrading endonuclease RelE of RelBE toxin-antitoxin system
LSCVLEAGLHGRVRFAVRPNGRMPASDEWESLDMQRQESFRALFRRLVRQGELLSEDQFKKLTGTEGLWQFKRSQFRILACRREGDILVLAVVRKGSQKLPLADRRRAEGICKDDRGGH